MPTAAPNGRPNATTTGACGERYRTEDELRKSIVDEFFWTSGVDGTRIGVGVNDGAVTLSGEAGSVAEKLLAVQAALRAPGVIAVADEITVRDAGGAVNDADVARDVGAALRAAVDVPCDAISATVHDAVVTLTGTVTWHFQRLAAVWAARTAPGALEVIDRILIRSEVPPAHVRSAVTAALIRRARAAAKSIAVESQPNGEVILSGTASESDIEAAAAAARAVPGVRQVRTDLRRA